MQKKNFYRSAWIKFRDDADMSVVMSELADKKVSTLYLTVNASPHLHVTDRRLQIAHNSHYNSVPREDQNNA